MHKCFKELNYFCQFCPFYFLCSWPAITPAGKISKNAHHSSKNFSPHFGGLLDVSYMGSDNLRKEIRLSGAQSAYRVTMRPYFLLSSGASALSIQRQWKSMALRSRSLSTTKSGGRLSVSIHSRKSSRAASSLLMQIHTEFPQISQFPFCLLFLSFHCRLKPDGRKLSRSADHST